MLPGNSKADDNNKKEVNSEMLMTELEKVEKTFREEKKKRLELEEKQNTNVKLIIKHRFQRLFINTNNLLKK